MIIIPSILNASTRAYKLVKSGTDNWNNRGSAPLLDQLTQYETYGDGTVQHSGDWCVQFAELTDVCLSLATAMYADPKAEHWQSLGRPMPCQENLRFALNVKFKEGKRQWYSYQQQKVTTSEKVRYDKRYEEVNQYINGDPAGALRVINPEYYDWLDKVRLVSALREEYYKMGGGYLRMEDIFKPLEELGKIGTDGKRRWRNALTAYEHALSAVHALDNTRSLIDICHHNMGLAKADAEKAA
ncbi:MAG TPA: hypothetical protein VNU68_34805 [Verrucomicrobiae bacterium]|nr:hypothetical protein [Verrucomicrobiae bacterium]